MKKDETGRRRHMYTYICTRYMHAAAAAAALYLGISTCCKHILSIKLRSYKVAGIQFFIIKGIL